MPTWLKELSTAPDAAVPRIGREDAVLIAKGEVLVLDLRNVRELQAGGKIKGAVHVPRGMLEFRADPESPYHDKAFSRDKPVIVYCASGGRAALAGKTLKEMGYGTVYNLGGFKPASEAGLPTEPA